MGTHALRDSVTAAEELTLGGARGRMALVGAIALAAVGAALAISHVVILLTVPAPQLRSAGLDRSGASIAFPLVVTACVALVLTTRRPRNPVGWLAGIAVVSLGTLLAGSAYMGIHPKDLPDAITIVVAVGVTIAWVTGFPCLLILMPLVFPDGHLLSRRWRWAVWSTLGTMAFALVTSLVPFGSPDNPIWGLLNGPVSGAALVALMATSIVSLVLRYRRAGPELRHQLKWFIAALAAAVIAVVPTLITGSGGPTYLGAIAFTAVPVSIGFAVLKYRLYDIDVVISRALVYGSLAALITAVYVGIVVGIGSFIGEGSRPNLALSIIATAIVAVGFQPVRERVSRVANRLVYGKRATPYEVLSEFSERVAESYASEEVLQRMARVLAQGTGASAADVWLRRGPVLERAAGWPVGPDAREPVPVAGQLLPRIDGVDRAVPVRHQGELLGALTVTKRRGDALTPIEERLVDDLAHQAGLVLKNVGLTADLQARLVDLRASRQRLVTAQDNERRRLERDLHDGAQQHLVALKVKLGLAETLALRDPGKAKALVAQLKDDADEALNTVRDLARGIYPPLLAEQGLGAALAAQARRATIPVTVDVPASGRYAQDVEAAVYFCVLEALQNVQKYAAANRAEVRVRAVDGELRFSVEDDGRGFDSAGVGRGAGLTNMGDRIDALGGHLEVTSSPGGGTAVTASLPVTAI